MIFIQVILPTLIVFAAGFLLQRKKQLNIGSISTVAMYIFIPCLIFRTLYQTDINLQYAYMIVFAIVLFMLTVALNKLYVKIKGLPASYESAYILSTAFMNIGNYGSPIILLAYGITAFDYAISFFVLQQILMNSFGLYYAARGQLAYQEAVKKVFQVPAFYAVMIVFIFKVFDLEMPENLFTVIDLLASAAIPTVMVILGMQLSMIKLKGFGWGEVTYATMLKLVGVPLAAYGLTLLFPFDPLLQKVLILCTAMPSAVVTTMFAVQFDAHPDLVSSTTLINTVASIGTITVLLLILG